MIAMRFVVPFLRVITVADRMTRLRSGDSSPSHHALNVGCSVSMACLNLSTAIEYYVNKGNVAAAIATKTKTTKSAKELADFQDMIVAEKAVEHYLEGHLDVIGDKINANLELVGRQ